MPLAIVHSQSSTGFAEDGENQNLGKMNSIRLEGSINSSIAVLSKCKELNAGRRKHRLIRSNEQRDTYDGFIHDTISKQSFSAKVNSTTLLPTTDCPQQSQTLPAVFKHTSDHGQEDIAHCQTVRSEEHGLFATERIEKGTRIISEAPLITLPSPGNQINDLRAAYDKLPEGAKARVWDLRSAPHTASEQLKAFSRAVQPAVATMVAILKKTEEEIAEEERSVLITTGPRLENMLETLRLAARWHANQRSLINLPEKERDNIPPGTPITGLFVKTAKLRHSCVPNCCITYRPALDQITVHVIRDVQPSEELTASAIADTMYYETAHVRKQRLDQFGILCACEACDSSHPNFTIHENARYQACARATMLAEFCTRLETVNFDTGAGDLDFRNSPHETTDLTLQHLTDAEQTIVALCRNLRTTGCTSVEQIRWRNALIDRIQPRLAGFQAGASKIRIWQAMVGHAKTCEAIGLKCYGKDCEEVMKLTARREKIIAILHQIQQRLK